MAKKTNDTDALIHETSSQRILLEEFRLLQGRYLNIRDEGVTRLNFFVTSVSVALGGVLVFMSGNSNMPAAYLKLILLVTLTILFIIGLEIYNTLVFRAIATDTIERGLARIRHYFIKLDPDIEDYFIAKVIDIPTNHLIMKNSRIRRSAQIIEGFLLGLSTTILSTFTALTPETDILIGCITTFLVYIFLEVAARRRLDQALRNAEKNVKFKVKVNS